MVFIIKNVEFVYTNFSGGKITTFYDKKPVNSEYFMQKSHRQNLIHADVEGFGRNLIHQLEIEANTYTLHFQVFT